MAALNRRNNRNSQLWGYSLLAWQAVVQSQPTETIFIHCVWKGFITQKCSYLGPPHGFLTCELFSLALFLYISHRPFFSLKHPHHLFYSHPCFLSICAPWSDPCVHPNPFSRFPSFTLWLSIPPPLVTSSSICVVCDSRAAIWGLSHERCCWHGTKVTP